MNIEEHMSKELLEKQKHKSLLLSSLETKKKGGLMNKSITRQNTLIIN